MLYQVIDVILESLLIIKKCLTDLALKTSIFVIDFSKSGAEFNSGAGLNYFANRSATITPGTL